MDSTLDVFWLTAVSLRIRMNFSNDLYLNPQLVRLRLTVGVLFLSNIVQENSQKNGEECSRLLKNVCLPLI